LGPSAHIPRFEQINERLHKATGWEIVGVPGLIPEVPFFTPIYERVQGLPELAADAQVKC